MTRQEFLSGLEAALSGQVDQQTLLDNIRYYRGYIDEEIRKGRTESEVLEELGNPRLIARTIIDAAEAGTGRAGAYSGSQGGFSRESEADRAYGPDFRGQDQYTGDQEMPGGFRTFRMGSSGCLILAMVLVLIAFLGISFVISSVIRLVYAFPGLVILGIIWYIIRSRRNGRY